MFLLVLLIHPDTFCHLTSTTSILERYTSHSKKMATSSKETNHAEVDYGKHANLKSLAELLLTVERNLEGLYAMELTLGDLMELEEQLHVALTHVKNRKGEENYSTPTLVGVNNGLLVRTEFTIGTLVVELKNLVDNIGDTNDTGISEVPPRPEKVSDTKTSSAVCSVAVCLCAILHEKMLKEENQLLEKQIVAMKNGEDSDHPLCHPPQQTTLSLLK
ncbi:hypothetical protein POTOM_012545 [Populus tomentosa]|uniref:K-box domain-containing protein n=1 Tax=Populus tomentosa TaxID=118781 RepID=A0A8X8D9I4_POPTO|nr:hypothetical protein POTOM_012545 [Populus tomentosa]